MKFFALSLLLMATTVLAQEPVQGVPSADEAIAAYATFNADPLNKLSAAGPFLNFIRGSGQIHIVLNDALLKFMNSDISDERKAQLYAAFLGGNMQSQLDSGKTGSDNVAAMSAALEVYRLQRKADGSFSIALFEALDAAELKGELPQLVAGIVSGDIPAP